MLVDFYIHLQTHLHAIFRCYCCCSVICSFHKCSNLILQFSSAIMILVWLCNAIQSHFQKQRENQVSQNWIVAWNFFLLSLANASITKWIMWSFNFVCVKYTTIHINTTGCHVSMYAYAAECLPKCRHTRKMRRRTSNGGKKIAIHWNRSIGGCQMPNWMSMWCDSDQYGLNSFICETKTFRFGFYFLEIKTDGRRWIT